jgi:D-alanyl-D-alanine carboxypeptidase
VVQRNYNTLLGRYPGADGMKTGFICASGFNLVATASRDGKRMIAVVLGAPSSAARAIKAAQLLERGFTANPLAWLTPSLGTVDSLVPINADPPNLRDEMCGPHRKRQATEDEDDSAAIASLSGSSAYSVFLSSLRPQNGKQNLLNEGKLGEPVVVFTGPPRKPGETKEIKTVVTDIKSKAASKAGPKALVKPVAAKAGAVPWTSLSPATLANHPPPELGGHQPGETPAAATPPKPKAKTAAKTAEQKKSATPKKSTKDSQATAKKSGEPQKP